MRIDDDVSMRLLDSAGRVLRDAGIHRISVRRIALDAEVSTMNVYSRFGSFSGLLDELVAEGFGEFGVAIAAFEPAGDAISDLVNFAEAYRGWVLEHPEKYRLMMTTAGAAEYHPGPPALEGRQKLLDGIIERVVAARALRKDDVPPMSPPEAAQVVLSMLHGMLMLELDGVVLEPREPGAWAQRFAAMVRFGLTQSAA